MIGTPPAPTLLYSALSKSVSKYITWVSLEKYIPPFSQSIQECRALSEQAAMA
jgi:hypothetical protein